MYSVAHNSIGMGGRPKSYKVYSKKEIQEFWLKNIGIVEAAREEDPIGISCFVINDEIIALSLTAALIREALNEDTGCVTYLPASGILFVNYTFKVNWIDGVELFIMNTYRRVINEFSKGCSRVKDKWGDVLFDLTKVNCG